MDLSNLDTTTANEGVRMDVRHPATGVTIDGMSLTVLGTDSKTYRDARKALARKRQNQRKKNDVDLDQMERDAISVLASLVVDWEGVEVDGERLPYTHENAMKVLQRFPWLFEQVDEFVADRANFLLSA